MRWEEQTGLDFFTELPDEQEEAMESAAAAAWGGYVRRGNEAQAPVTRGFGHCHGPRYRASAAWVWHRVLYHDSFFRRHHVSAVFLHLVHFAPRCASAYPWRCWGLLFPWLTRDIRLGQTILLGSAIIPPSFHARLPADQIHHGRAGRETKP